MAGNDKAPDQENATDEDDGRDGYFMSARVLTYMLRHSTRAGNPTIPFLVLCTPDVSARKRDRLTRDGATVAVVEKLVQSWVHPKLQRWRDVMAKLRLFELTQWRKICFLDADTLVMEDISGVFQDEATRPQTTQDRGGNATKPDEAALPATYVFASHNDARTWRHDYPLPSAAEYLNSGFFVLAPSTQLFDYYMSVLAIPDRFPPGLPEQNLLNYAHRPEGNMPWQPLWHGWNVNCPNEDDFYGGAKSFHDKYWTGEHPHDTMIKAVWARQRVEMERFYAERDDRDILRR